MAVLLVVTALLTGATAQDTAGVSSATDATIVGAQGSSEAADEEFDHVVVVRSSRKSNGSGNPADATSLSSDFTAAALAAAFQMQSTERSLEQSIKRGFPLGEFWIQNDLDQVDDALNLAALNVTNEADLEALRRLESQSSQLRLWSDWLVQANRNLQLAEYYISPSTLDNDERFQSTVACTGFLISMLTSRRLTEDRSCH